MLVDSHPSQCALRTAPYLGCAAREGSFSSVETVTPESAIGRPSLVTVDSWSPHSEAATERFGGSYKASVQNSSSSSLQLRLQPPSGSCELRALAGEFRRNKYREPLLSNRQTALQVRADPAVLQAWPSASSSTSGDVRKRFLHPPCSSDTVAESEVLIEGPLQQRSFLFFWPERWCVLDESELRIYRDEEEAVLQSDNPLQRHRVDKLRLSLDLHLPSVMNCIDTDTGETLTCLRTGCGSRWEEVAATSLWLAVFSRVRGDELAFLLGSHL